MQASPGLDSTRPSPLVPLETRICMMEEKSYHHGKCSCRIHHSAPLRLDESKEAESISNEDHPAAGCRDQPGNNSCTDYAAAYAFIHSPLPLHQLAIPTDASLPRRQAPSLLLPSPLLNALRTRRMVAQTCTATQQHSRRKEKPEQHQLPCASDAQLLGQVLTIKAVQREFSHLVFLFLNPRTAFDTILYLQRHRKRNERLLDTS